MRTRSSLRILAAALGAAGLFAISYGAHDAQAQVSNQKAVQGGGTGPSTGGPTRTPPAGPARIEPPQVGSVGQGAAAGLAGTPSNANPDNRLPPTTGGPQAPGGVAAMPVTGLCAQGFSKYSEIKGMHAGKQVYTSYTCEGQAPKCAVQRAAVEKEPALYAVDKVSVGGAPGGASAAATFQIKSSYKSAFEYSCNIPANCMQPALNGNANHVQVEVNRWYMGDKIHYKCTYVWNQG